MISLERAPPPTRRLHTIERTQGWSMLFFFPLQHLSFLRTNDLIPSTLPPRITNDRTLSLWSTRFWMAYVVLQLAHLREDRTLLVKRQRALDKLSSREKLQPQERVEIARRWDAWYNELAVNLSFLPMTIHWSAAPPSPFTHILTRRRRSLEKGLFGNDVSCDSMVSGFGY
jgi:hypothetical protein